MGIKRIVEESDTPLGKAFDLTIQGLIVFSLITYSLETLPNLSERMRYLLHLAQLTTIAIFTAEYLLRVVVADKPSKYMFSFFGIVDFLAIAPFYLASGMDLRAVRALRLLRLIRILKLARYSHAAQRFHRAFLLIRDELALFLFVALILLFLSAVAVYNFERDAQPEAFASVFHSLWWAVVTLTTVGYGDVYPITLGGKVATFFILFIGLGIVAVPAGLVATALSRARDEEAEEQRAPRE